MWSIMSGQVLHRFNNSVYLLYWYKSTNSHTWRAASLATRALSRFTTQFNCCTFTKVQILTLTHLHSFVGHTRPVTSISVSVAFGTYVLVSGSLDCTVRVLNFLALLVQTSTNTLVAFSTYVLASGSLDCTVRVLNFLALLVQSTNTDAAVRLTAR